MYTWYYKSGQEPRVGELTDPKGEPTDIILLNGQHSERQLIQNHTVDQSAQNKCLWSVQL